MTTVIRLFYSDYLQNHLWGFAGNSPCQLPCFQNNSHRNHFRINYSFISLTLLIPANLSKEEIVLLKTPSYETNWPRKLFQRIKQRYTWEKSLSSSLLIHCMRPYFLQLTHYDILVNAKTHFIPSFTPPISPLYKTVRDSRLDNWDIKNWWIISVKLLSYSECFQNCLWGFFDPLPCDYPAF